MSATDRGLAYGDGVFRTFPVRAGAARFWRRHYLKLTLDCKRIGIVPPDEATLEREVACVASMHSDCVVKIMVTRGSAERGYRYGAGQPTRIVASSKVPRYPESNRNSGVRVRTCALRLARQPALAGVKHLNRLENVLARAEWSDEQIAEGILCDTDGHAVGGTMTNLFIVRNGRLATPDLAHCGVAGVTRDRVVDASYRQGVPCELRAIAMEEVRSADEVFLVNSVVGLWPVSMLDGEAMSIGAVTRSVQRWLEEESDAQVA